jgi:bacterioferritin (cytochrome b1)
MLKWLKEILAGDELRAKDKIIDSYRERVRQLENVREQLERLELRVQIYEGDKNMDELTTELAKYKAIEDEYKFMVMSGSMPTARGQGAACIGHFGQRILGISDRH